MRAHPVPTSCVSGTVAIVFDWQLCLLYAVDVFFPSVLIPSLTSLDVGLLSDCRHGGLGLPFPVFNPLRCICSVPYDGPGRREGGGESERISWCQMFFLFCL